MRRTFCWIRGGEHECLFLYSVRFSAGGFGIVSLHSMAVTLEYIRKNSDSMYTFKRYLSIPCLNTFASWFLY